MKILLTWFFSVSVVYIDAQIPDHIYKPNIRSVTLTKAGDPYSYPEMSLNSGEQFELHFDDMDADVKTY